MSDAATTQHASAKDGTTLLVRHWPVTNGVPWASILLLHGLAEHSGRYEHVGAQFAAAGIDAWAYDQRGFGESGGARAFIDRWSQHHDDLEERIAAVRAAMPSRPLVLYGHSLGALIALGYVLDGRSRPDLLVLSAPAVYARVPLWQRLLVASLVRVAPGMQIKNRLNTSDLSSDAAVRAKYVSDPLNYHSSTLRFASAAFAEQRRVAASLDRLSIQALVVHGGEDRLVPTASSAAFAGMTGVTRRVYPGLSHEVHNEPTGAMVVKDIVTWIRERASRMHVSALG